MGKIVEDHRLSDKFFLDSAGCITYGGEEIGKRTRLTLQDNKIPLNDEHISKPFTIQDYNTFDCIIALDNRTLNITKKISQGDPNNKIRLFRDFEGNDISVADPGFNGDHLRAFEEIYIGCKNLLNEFSSKAI